MMSVNMIAGDRIYEFKNGYQAHCGIHNLKHYIPTLKIAWLSSCFHSVAPPDTIVLRLRSVVLLNLRRKSPCILPGSLRFVKHRTQSI